MYPRSRQTPVQHEEPETHPIQRIRWWYGLLLVFMGVCVVRLFYLQVIRHDYYQKAAYSSQLRHDSIPAARGVISAYDGTDVVPLVLNETLFTLTADPVYVKDAGMTALELQKLIGGDAGKYEKLMKTPDTRYVVLATKLTRQQNDAIVAKKLKGIRTVGEQYRTYPDGQLASQILGFVNQDNEGKYGIEQYLDKELKGTPGQLKAITDAQGVPLPANKDNIVTDPVPGKQVVLTLDVGLQQQAEDLLKQQVTDAKAKSGSLLVLEANTGAVKAMANYPTYDPAQYSKVSDASLFNNDAVSAPLEVGSVMKSLTTAAALDSGAVGKDQTYYDPSYFKVDGATVKNVEEDGGAGTKSVYDILRLSLNTGATWLLMQMGGGEINAKARQTWHSYMTDHYRLGKATGIEQGYEDPGYIPDPEKGYGLNITYANTAFGQGMLATPLQMGAAFAAAVNGGTYYKPHLISQEVDAKGSKQIVSPTVVNDKVISGGVSATLRTMLENTFSANQRVYTDLTFSDAYSIGGKTGTAQISKPTGGYYDDRFNGTYLGFVGGDQPQYVIVVRVSEPHTPGYAGAKAAAPLFSHMANVLINNYGVAPKK